MAEYVKLLLNGRWCEGSSAATLPLVNPATGESFGFVACATASDLEHAVEAAQAGFKVWSKMSAYERSAILRAAAQLLRTRGPAIAEQLTREQGKPFKEALGELQGGADFIDWCAEEGRRAYGRIVPSRSAVVEQKVIKRPIGPVAAFTPWNFPVNQAVRKIAGALAAGCSILVKGPEETPGSCAELVRCFVDAGVPDGVVGLVFGEPAMISQYLIGHPVIRKVSFTGSTVIGKLLASQAGAHMKPCTMELGGHAPVLIFDDADLDLCVPALVAAKYRNAGQVCISPTRVLVQAGIYERFLERYARAVKAIKVGDGFATDTEMGPVVSERRLDAVMGLIDDAVGRGAILAAGGRRGEGKGYFIEPTVLTEVPQAARVMQEEPFGPVSLVNRFDTYEQAIAEANRLNYGLASYVYTRSLELANRASQDIEAGIIGINHHAVAFAETPFGGTKDSGFGSEGGSEVLDAYLETALVSTCFGNL
ncbi:MULTISPECIES: NAD-dependent succinate-semialdehyde dehydrogenase [Pseudomonas]|uniref:NAD-dependent succinate-semialdehyde dehydrogenase n=1 Tax=Pseudomonas TaxID=286 RepID=UPI001E285808|nr:MULTISPECIES: NAD-dependent succinate-semialdehyde dehydrogenase [Pseudomonas]EKT4502761.1 NAD-dependent succinate-semialdehyde dehydrogenase [Pseudomonas putida]MCK1156631.1 NAD-dependent succinate-semialdehyde dehydrogenase [Pseudomonas aeruginosa]MDM3893858.1 NAD-dependent succinate-semialdehyde dehydrogenase [Pseudomonas juntendi]